MKIHILNAVWGKDFIDTFVNLSLPFQFASGNLKFLKENADVTYKIFTIPEDEKLIRSSINFKKLSSLVRCELVSNIDKFAEDKYQRITDFYKIGIIEANKEDAGIIFLSPDIILGKDVFKNLFSFISQGKKLIPVMSIRLNLEDFTKDIMANNHFHIDNTIEIGAKDLIKLALNHLHQITQSIIWNENEKICTWPSHIYWKTKNGIIGRCFHLHPFFVWPENKDVKIVDTYDVNYAFEACPNKNTWKIITSSEDIVIFEVSSQKKLNIPLKKKSSVLLAYWALKNRISKEHLEFFKNKIHYITEDVDKIKFDQSDNVVNSCLFFLKIPILLSILGFFRFRLPELLKKLFAIGIKLKSVITRFYFTTSDFLIRNLKRVYNLCKRILRFIVRVFYEK